MRACDHQDVIAKLKYDGVIVSDIDYYRCEITYTCLRCGRKIVRSFFDNSSNVCPHCHMEKYAYGTLSLEDAREKRASICGHSRTDYFDIEISPKEKEDKLVFTVSEDEQTLTVLVVGEESRCGEDAIYLRHYLKYLLTYSLKEGGTAKELSQDGTERNADMYSIFEKYIFSAPRSFLKSQSVVWEGAESSKQFFLQHSSFFEKIGYFRFWDEYSGYKGSYIDEHMLRYIALKNGLPVFDKFIKREGYAVASWLFDIRRTERNWKEAFKNFPDYLIDYLAKSDAGYMENMFWMRNWKEVDIRMSEEEFKEFTSDIEYKVFQVEVGWSRTLLDLFDAGYDPQELKRYLVRQCCNDSAGTLIRYRRLCEEKGLEPEKYPEKLINLDLE